MLLPDQLQIITDTLKLAEDLRKRVLQGVFWEPAMTTGTDAVVTMLGAVYLQLSVLIDLEIGKAQGS